MESPHDFVVSRDATESRPWIASMNLCSQDSGHPWRSKGRLESCPLLGTSQDSDPAENDNENVRWNGRWDRTVEN